MGLREPLPSLHRPDISEFDMESVKEAIVCTKKRVVLIKLL